MSLSGRLHAGWYAPLSSGRKCRESPETKSHEEHATNWGGGLAKPIISPLWASDSAGICRGWTIGLYRSFLSLNAQNLILGSYGERFRSPSVLWWSSFVEGIDTSFPFFPFSPPPPLLISLYVKRSHSLCKASWLNKAQGRLHPVSQQAEYLGKSPNLTPFHFPLPWKRNNNFPDRMRWVSVWKRPRSHSKSHRMSVLVVVVPTRLPTLVCPYQWSRVLLPGALFPFQTLSCQLYLLCVYAIQASGKRK